MSKSKPQSGLDLFTPLADEAEYLKLLIYGPAGVGKTTSALTASAGGRIIVINAEGGLKKQALVKAGVNVDNVSISNIRSDTLTHDELEQIIDRIDSELTKDRDSIYAIVVDSLTELHTALRERATDDRRQREIAKGRTPDPSLIDRADYGVMTNQLRRTMRRLRDMPVHVIYTALERVDDSTATRGPALSPALAGDAIGYVDVVAYMRADDLGGYGSPISRRARLAPQFHYAAKDRFNVLPATMPDPTVTRILSYIEGTLTPDNDPTLKAMATAVADKKNTKN